MVIASTAHMTKADDEWCWGVLEARSDSVLSPGDILLCGFEYGWIFNTGLYPQMNDAEFTLAGHYDCGSLSPELLALIDRARGSGSKYLMLDRDGPEVEGLPTFDW
jgi:hypothetical protein